MSDETRALDWKFTDILAKKGPHVMDFRMLRGSTNVTPHSYASA
jgi:hypothetical protein